VDAGDDVLPAFTPGDEGNYFRFGKDRAQAADGSRLDSLQSNGFAVLLGGFGVDVVVRHDLLQMPLMRSKDLHEGIAAFIAKGEAQLTVK
jgi:hypothetical protein